MQDAPDPDTREAAMIGVVGGPQRVGGMYQNPAARLRLIEGVGVHNTLMRTEEPGTAEELRS